MNDIQVGDLVTIRSWDDMAREFEVDFEGDIHIPEDGIFFTRSMKPLCGHEFTIMDIDKYGYCDLCGVGSYTFSHSMFDRSREECPAPDVDVSSFLEMLA